MPAQSLSGNFVKSAKAQSLASDSSKRYCRKSASFISVPLPVGELAWSSRFAEFFYRMNSQSLFAYVLRTLTIPPSCFISGPSSQSFWGWIISPSIYEASAHLESRDYWNPALRKSVLQSLWSCCPVFVAIGHWLLSTMKTATLCLLRFHRVAPLWFRA